MANLFSKLDTASDTDGDILLVLHKPVLYNAKPTGVTYFRGPSGDQKESISLYEAALAWKGLGSMVRTIPGSLIKTVHNLPPHLTKSHMLTQKQRGTGSQNVPSIQGTHCSVML